LSYGFSGEQADQIYKTPLSFTATIHGRVIFRVFRVVLDFIRAPITKKKPVLGLFLFVDRLVETIGSCQPMN
jgi:hypothetical protein